MSIYAIVMLFLALPSVSGQFQNYSKDSFCKAICQLAQNCKPTSTYCTSDSIRNFVNMCGCNAPIATRAPTIRRTTTTIRRPVIQNGCGIGGMGNARRFLNSLPRIVGGFDAPSGHFPWQVKVRPGKYHCGGTLVNSDTVVTAAHCVYLFENKPKSVEVGFGSIDTNKTQKVNASRVIIHPSYGRTSQPDIAIIKLNRSISFSRFVQPACLPRENQTVAANRLALVTGWGKLLEGNSTIPNILQYVAVPIVNQSQCNAYYNGGIKDGEFCAGFVNGGRDACAGDSGGALVMPNPSGRRWELVGVVSRGIGCARKNYPGIYTRVPSYVSWIRRYM